MNDKLLRQNDTCCILPTGDPNYTVCFPSTQTLPGGIPGAPNPTYNFGLQESYWTYEISVDEQPAVSQWFLQICTELAAREEKDDFKVELSVDGGANFSNVASFDVNVAPQFGIPETANSLQIQRGIPQGETYIFRITIKNPTYFDLAAEVGGNITLRISGGEEIYNSTTCTDPNEPLPTPSFDCNRVPPPQVPMLFVCKQCQTSPTGFFTIGDTVTITIVLSNTGLIDVNATVQDVITVPNNVTIDNLNTLPAATSIVPATGPYTDTAITITWNQTVPAGQTLPLLVSFTIIDAPVEGAFIENTSIDVIDVDPDDTDVTFGDRSCLIPVRDVIEPTRGVKIFN